MYGGWTAAVLLQAVLESADCRSDALTVGIDGQLPPADRPGERGRHRRLPPRGGRSLEHWRVDGCTRSTASCCATALLVLTHRPETDRTCSSRCRSCRRPRDSSRSTRRVRRGSRPRSAEVSGEWGSGDTRGCPLAARRLRTPARSPAARVPRRPVRARPFLWGVGMRPSATITLSVHFHATADGARCGRLRLRAQRGDRHARRALDLGPAGSPLES